MISERQACVLVVHALTLLNDLQLAVVDRIRADDVSQTAGQSMVGIVPFLQEQFKKRITSGLMLYV